MNKEQRATRGSFYTMLGIPVIVCIGIGIFFALSDPMQGLTLIAVGIGLAVINGLILRFLLRKLDDSEQENP